jgi:hypothetical protein
MGTQKRSGHCKMAMAEFEPLLREAIEQFDKEQGL